MGSGADGRGYHGWRIAWALAVTQTVGFGVLFYAFGVFVLPMEQELGLTRSQTSGAYSLALLLSGLLAVPVGRWVDARGARLPMTVGSAAGAALVWAWSTVDSLAGLYLVQAGIGLVMALVLYDVAFTVLAAWFRRDRIRAMLVVTSVAGLASTIFIPLATALVEGWGWRGGLRALALLLGAVTVPLHALVLRDRPERRGEAPDGADPPPAGPGPADDVRGPRAASESPGAAAGGSPASVEGSGAGVAPPPAGAEPATTFREALRSVVFWRLSGAFALDRIVVVAVAAHAVPLLLERGHAPGLVAAVTGSIGLMQVVGRLAFAPAARGWPLARLAALTFAVRAAGLAALALLPGAAAPWAFALLFGLANGATTLARAGLVGEAFGSAHYGAINGAMSSLVAVVQTVAPLAVGALRVLTGGYAVALWALAGVTVAAVGAVAGLRTGEEAPGAARAGTGHAGAGRQDADAAAEARGRR